VVAATLVLAIDANRLVHCYTHHAAAQVAYQPFLRVVDVHAAKGAGGMGPESPIPRT
jgi:hypothetical protein